MKPFCFSDSISPNFTIFSIFIYAALQIRDGHRSISANLQPLTTHINHLMIIITSGFSNKSLFYYYYFYFLEILLNDLELVFLEYKHIYKTQRPTLLSSYLLFFTCCFKLILCINILHLFILFHFV